MSHVEYPSPIPRRVSRPRWLDLRLVLGVVLVLVSVVIGATVMASAHRTHSRLAVTHDLAVGTTLRSDDVRSVDVQLPASAEVYVSDASQVLGKVLNRPLSSGELLSVHDLGTAPGRTTVNVPFAADAAPRLARGQRIVVWLSTERCPEVVLLPDVTVQDVRASDTGSFATAEGGQSVVLSVTPELAQRVVTALAIKDATIRAGVLSGSAVPATAGGPAALPDISPCVSS